MPNLISNWGNENQNNDLIKEKIIINPVFLSEGEVVQVREGRRGTKGNRKGRRKEFDPLT